MSPKTSWLHQTECDVSHTNLISENLHPLRPNLTRSQKTWDASVVDLLWSDCVGTRPTVTPGQRGRRTLHCSCEPQDAGTTWHTPTFIIHLLHYPPQLFTFRLRPWCCDPGVRTMKRERHHPNLMSRISSASAQWTEAVNSKQKSWELQWS